MRTLIMLRRTGVKKVMWLFGAAVMASMSLYAAPGFCEDDNNGDYVSAVAPKGKNAVIPPGDLGIIALYADELLSNAPSTTTYWNVIASTLFDGVDDPALAGEISDFFVVDTRTPAESCTGHLPMATINPAQNYLNIY